MFQIDNVQLMSGPEVHLTRDKESNQKVIQESLGF